MDNFTSKWPLSLPRPYTASPHAFYAVESRAWAVALAIRLGSVLPKPSASSSRKSGRGRRTKKTAAKMHERARKNVKAAAASEPGARGRKAMAALDGAGAGAGGGCTGSRGAAR